MFPEHVERSFLDHEYSFDEYFQLGSRTNIRPIKNGLWGGGGEGGGRGGLEARGEGGGSVGGALEAKGWVGEVLETRGEGGGWVGVSGERPNETMEQNRN